MKQPLCTDCAYYSERECRFWLKGPSPVDGKIEARYTAKQAREDAGLCGPEGSRFKDTSGIKAIAYIIIFVLLTGVVWAVFT
jgi:hypothetical protein